MRDQLIIRLTENAPEQVSWVRLSEVNALPEISHGQLREAGESQVGAQVVVLAPATDVLHSTAKVPTQNKSRLLKAVPYALEEELAADVELLHFAIGKPDSSGQVKVAVVERSLMDSWLQMLADAGISTDIIISEQSLVPIADNSWSLVLDGNIALLQAADYQGMVADVENLGVILPLVIKEQAEQLPKDISVWHDEANRGVTPLIPDEINVIHEQLEDGLLGLIAEQPLALDNTVNLLQGDYSKREQFGKLWRPWRYAASLAAVWFVLQLGLAYTESAQLKSEYDALRSEAREIYKSAFPNSKRIVNIRAQMKQGLSKLQGKKVSKKTGFLSLLADSGMVFKQTSGLVLHSIRYKNGMLDVELEVPSLQVLDQLKQKLSQTGKLAIEIQSAASRKNIVQGRLQIKSKA